MGLFLRHLLPRHRLSLHRGLLGLLAACLLFAGVAARAEKGINGNELYALSPDQLAATVRTYQQLGVQWVRFDFDWSVIQPSPRGWNFDGHDRAVAALRSAGIQVLGILDYTPGWANGGQASKYYPPTSNKAFAKFAATVAARYAPQGVHAWEIWNEPNLAQFWAPAADASAYTALLKEAAVAIRRQDPRAFIVSGGLAQPDTSATSISALQFVQWMYASGARGSFDALGDHPYTAPLLPNDPNAYAWQVMASTPMSLLSVMAANGDGDKRIWITEYGAPTSGTSPYGTVVSETTQATMVTQSLRAAAAAGWAGPVFWYNLQDWAPYSPSASSEAFFGLLRADGSAKPGFDAYLTEP
jgi:hypothetical protein